MNDIEKKKSIMKAFQDRADAREAEFKKFKEQTLADDMDSLEYDDKMPIETVIDVLKEADTGSA